MPTRPRPRPTRHTRRASRARASRLVAILAAVAIAALGLVAVTPASPAGAATTVPTGWIAKQYTELLGRAPTPTEWTAAVAHYTAAPACDATSLAWLSADVSTGLALSTEFTTLYPGTTDLDKALRSTALIRAAYSHDPNDNDWNNFVVPYLSNARDWPATVAAIYSGAGFGLFIVPGACSSTSPSTGFPYQPPIDVRQRLGLGASRTAAEINTALAGASGTVVTLRLGEVIRVGGTASGNANLWVKQGVTFTTEGTWSHPAGAGLAYARMGRVVATNGLICTTYVCNDVGIVRTDAGATVANIWVDGQAASVNSYKLANIETAGSTAAAPTTVRDNRITDPGRDGTGIRARGFSTGLVDCTNQTIRGNLLTGYASAHTSDSLGRTRAVDGIAVMCESATVTQNHLVDITDAGIVAYGSYSRGWGAVSTQRSSITDNTVLSAGLDGQVALGADAIGECASSGGNWLAPCLDVDTSRPFTGTTFTNNRYWTGTRTSFDVGLMVGGGVRWGNHRVPGSGVAFQGNTTGGITTRVNIGISIDAMFSATVSGNATTFQTVDGSPGQTWSKCPTGAVLLAGSTRASVAAGSQATTANDAQDGCLIGDIQSGGLERLAPSSDAKGFVGTTTQRAFVPWGFDAEVGTLAWTGANAAADWARLVSDLREHRRMGANIVRVLVPFDKVVGPPDATHPDGTPIAAGLTWLTNLATLANQTGMYLDVTGLGIEEPHPTVTWDDQLDEQGWWRAHRVFWAAAAGALKSNNAVAWYDLINEPAVRATAAEIPAPTPGLSSWCFASVAPCYNPLLTRTPGTRTKVQIARAWTQMMVDGIRQTAGDTATPISTGLIENGWSGYMPADVADLQSFALLHVYPCLQWKATHVDPDPPCEQPAIDDDIATTIAAKPANQALVIEETGSLNSSTQQQDAFMAGTRTTVGGWVMHDVGGYTPAELQGMIRQAPDFPTAIKYAMWNLCLMELMRNTVGFLPTGASWMQP